MADIEVDKVTYFSDSTLSYQSCSLCDRLSDILSRCKYSVKVSPDYLPCQYIWDDELNEFYLLKSSNSEHFGYVSVQLISYESKSRMVEAIFEFTNMPMEFIKESIERTQPDSALIQYRIHDEKQQATMTKYLSECNESNITPNNKPPRKFSPAVIMDWEEVEEEGRKLGREFLKAYEQRMNLKPK